MAYYNEKKVLSVVKTIDLGTTLDLGENADIKYNTLELDGRIIATFNDIDYRLCVSSDEDIISEMESGSHCHLPDKVVSSIFQAPSIQKWNEMYLFRYSNIATLNIESSTQSGELRLIDTSVIASAYLINENGHFVLYYNLAN